MGASPPPWQVLLWGPTPTPGGHVACTTAVLVIWQQLLLWVARALLTQLRVLIFWPELDARASKRLADHRSFVVLWQRFWLGFRSAACVGRPRQPSMFHKLLSYVCAVRRPAAQAAQTHQWEAAKLPELCLVVPLWHLGMFVALCGKRPPLN